MRITWMWFLLAVAAAAVEPPVPQRFIAVAVDDFRVAIFRRWLDAGLEFGNRGYAHLDLHRVSPEEWMAGSQP